MKKDMIRIPSDNTVMLEVDGWPMKLRDYLEDKIEWNPRIFREDYTLTQEELSIIDGLDIGDSVMIKDEEILRTH